MRPTARHGTSGARPGASEFFSGDPRQGVRSPTALPARGSGVASADQARTDDGTNLSVVGHGLVRLCTAQDRRKPRAGIVLPPSKKRGVNGLRACVESLEEAPPPQSWGAGLEQDKTSATLFFPYCSPLLGRGASWHFSYALSAVFCLPMPCLLRSSYFAGDAGFTGATLSRARFRASTLTPGSPRKPSERPCVFWAMA